MQWKRRLFGVLVSFALSLTLMACAGSNFDEGKPAAPCDADEHVVSNACEGCAPGTENEAGDDPSGQDTECAAVLCDADEHVVSNACVACAPGHYNDAGDDATGDDTDCETDACYGALGVRCEAMSETYLKASDPIEDGRFGWSVAQSADGNTLAVSAANETVYVFTRAGASWSQQATLTASNAFAKWF